MSASNTGLSLGGILRTLLRWPSAEPVAKPIDCFGAAMRSGFPERGDPELPAKAALPASAIGNPGRWAEATTAAQLYTAMYPGVKGPDARFAHALSRDKRALDVFAATAHEPKQYADTFKRVLTALTPKLSDEQLATLLVSFPAPPCNRHDHSDSKSNLEVLRETISTEQIRRDPPEKMGLRQATLAEIAEFAIAHVTAGGEIDGGRYNGAWAKDGQTRWRPAPEKVFVPAGDVTLRPRHSFDTFVVLTVEEAKVGGDPGKSDVVLCGGSKTLVIGPDVQAIVRQTRPELVPV